MAKVFHYECPCRHFYTPAVLQSNHKEDCGEDCELPDHGHLCGRCESPLTLRGTVPKMPARAIDYFDGDYSIIDKPFGP